jgi:diadenosine hexaphosphate hydrolase (ATP-forming)
MGMRWGGVLIDAQGRTLLRKASGGFDGMDWTFAKGGGDAGESPEQIALREVLEETGWKARVIRPLPGVHKGGTTLNRYFLMAPLEDTGKFDWETSEVRWVDFEEAARLLALSPNPVGRARDLTVLQLAIEAWNSMD